MNAVMRRLFRLAAVQRWWSARYRAHRGGDIPWNPPDKPLSGARVVLLTTGGVHLRGDTPFDMTDPQGDPSFRVIPSDTPAERLTITHDYYDHRDADADVNVVFPIDVLRELAANGEVGGLTPHFYSFMGHIEGPHVRTLMERTAAEVAERFRAEGADAALLVPA